MLAGLSDVYRGVWLGWVVRDMGGVLERLYNYRHGEDSVASSGLGTRAL